MARIRTIKPEIMQDEKLAARCPLTRLVFMGLITQADDAGRLHDNVKLLDGLLFPFTDDTCREALDELAEMGLILRYRTANGQRLIQMVNWDKHQKVKNPSLYVLPAPPSGESGEDRGRVGGETPDPAGKDNNSDDNPPSDKDLNSSSVDSTETLRRVGGESNAPTPDPRSPNNDPRPSTRGGEPATDGRTDERSLAIAEMTPVVEAYAEREIPEPPRRKAFIATARGIIAGEDRTAWEDGTGQPAPWPERPRLLRLALDRLAAGESDKLRGALRWVVPQQLDPDRQRPAIKGEAKEYAPAPPAITPPADPSADRRKLEQESPALYAEALAEFERCAWWNSEPETEKVRHLRLAIREKTPKMAIVR